MTEDWQTCSWNEVTNDRIVLVYKGTFLKAIGISENPKGFQMQKPMSEEFQLLLNQNDYDGELKEKKFKKWIVPSLWTILMHLILWILSIKYGGIDTMRKD